MRYSCFAEVLVLMLLLAGSLSAGTECEVPEGSVFVGVRGEVLHRNLLCRTDRDPKDEDLSPVLRLSACGHEMTTRELQLAGAESPSGPIVELTESPQGENVFVVSIQIPTTVASEGCEEMRGSLEFGKEPSASEAAFRFDVRIEDVHSNIDESYLLQFNQECQDINCSGFDVVAFVAREISRARASRYAELAESIKDGRMSQSEAWNQIEGKILQDNSDSKFARQALRRERCYFSTSDYSALVSGDKRHADPVGLRAISVLGEREFFEVCNFSEAEVLMKRRSMGDESIDLKDLKHSDSARPGRSWRDLVFLLLNAQSECTIEK